MVDQTTSSLILMTGIGVLGIIIQGEEMMFHYQEQKNYHQNKRTKRVRKAKKVQEVKKAEEVKKTK